MYFEAELDMDITMPEKSGLDALKEIISKDDDAKIKNALQCHFNCKIKVVTSN